MQKLTEQQIREGNKIIADFMGGLTSDMSKIVSGYQNIWLPIHGVCRWDTVEIGKGKILKYHKSWDWLMPVVEKINKRDWVTIYRDECKIHSLVSGEFEDIQIIKEGCPLIEAVYEAVVEFIKWYNENEIT